MILLEGNSLTATGVISPETMPLQLKERDTSATITTESAEGIAVGAWIQDDEEPGAGIVYRVRSIQQAFNARTFTIALEHIISVLKDQILFGEIKPADITGNPGDTTCTARQAVEYILARQSDWILGQFDFDNVSNPYKFDGDTLFEALETVTKSLEDAWWTYDMSVYPFKLNIIQLSADVDSEMRAGRNLKTITRTIERTGMYTRFFPIGKDDLHISGGGYVERNVSTYGAIEKSETDTSLTTEAELIAWANERLRDHAQPVVTISAEGLELSRETGESLDEITIGRVCRVPLPEYDTTIQERIIEKNYSDKIREKESFKVTMANSRPDVTKIIAEALKKSGKSGRGSARQSKEDHAWFEDTNDHVSMTAIGIIGVDAQGNPNWTRMSEFIADGEGLHAKVQTQMGEVTDKIATIEVTEEEIRTAVAASSSTIYSTIEQTASGINQQVARRTRVFVQLTDPALVPTNNVREGDIWVKSIKMQTWNDMASKTWTSSSDFNWNQYSGSPQFVWDGSKWEPLGDSGLVTEYGTRIEQTERNISLIAMAIGAIDPSAIASIDISAEAIQSAVSTAKSELYSVIRQTATNITSEVVNDITDISTYVEQTASSFAQAVARKNKVYIQMSDPANYTGNTVIDGDIWIKSVADNNIKPTWSELSAKTWTSQNSTNWREYYSSKWYVRKDGAWEIMREDADVVEIGTKLEQDEQHIALIARNVDANHQELGARLEVTAQQIRGEVHAAKSSLYSVVEQTATYIMHQVVDENAGNFSTITQTSETINLSVGSAKSALYSSIMQTATYVRTQVASAKSDMSSSINQTASSIRSEVNAAKSSLYSSITQTATYVRTEVASAKSSLSSSIQQTASSIRSEVNAAKSSEVNAAKSSLYSTITQTASSIRLEVSSTASGLQSQITTNAGNIELKVSKSGVISSINQTSESITISAAKINLSGYVKATDITADYLKSKISNIDILNTKRIHVQNDIQAGSIYYTSALIPIHQGVWDVRIKQSGNNYTLQKYQYNGSEWINAGSFSRAVSSWSWAGGNGQVKVTAQPQNQTLGVDVRVSGNASITSNGTYTYKAQYEDDNGSYWDTGASKSVSVNVKPEKADIGASRGQRSTTQPSADATLTNIILNGYYVITVTAMGTSKTFRLYVNV